MTRCISVGVEIKLVRESRTARGLSQSGSTASDHEPAEPTQGSCDGIQISAGLDSAESRGD